MKKARKFLYTVAIALAIAAVSLFVVACGEKEKKPAVEYTLKFWQGTSVYETVTGVEGSAVELQKGDPTRVNCVFEGWSLTQDGEVVALPTKMPAKNMDFYAVFSVQYRLTLDPGIGTLPDGDKTIMVKAGDSIYDLVSKISPAIDGDATFSAWYYNNKAVTSESQTVMPAADVKLKAKYEVAYSINEYKQTAYEDDDSYKKEPSKSGKGFVGEIVKIPTYVGFRYDDSKDDKAATVALSVNSANNGYDLYYSLIGYNVAFGANLPSDVTVGGTMDNMVMGYGVEYTVPECSFSAAGYRFAGWSTAMDGDIEYKAGSKISVTRATVLYAIWDKGLTEASGKSSDYVFICNDDNGNKVAYLDRFGLADEKRGVYNAANGIFTFSNENGVVALRGIADLSSGTFIYLKSESANTYSLRSIDGSVDATKTLQLKDDGVAVYNNGDGNVNGTYAYDKNAGALKFSYADNKAFYFRVSRTRNESGEISVFEIRGEEFGTWNYMNALGKVDPDKFIEFDGFGGAVLHINAFNSNFAAQSFKFAGYYVYGDKISGIQEITVAVINNSGKVKTIACLPMTGEFGTTDKKYTNVYLEWSLGTTLYKAPEAGAELDIATAESIALDGYGIFNDSAVYTHKNTSGETVTEKGMYYFDSSSGLLLLAIDKDTVYSFILGATKVGDDNYITFETPHEMYGNYAISGLENKFSPIQNYPFRILNDTQAEFRILLPLSDSFYGTVTMDYASVVRGTYRLLDAENKIYEFNAELDPAVVYNVAAIYSTLSKGTILNISGFGKFKFKLTGSYAGTATALGDAYGGITVTCDGVSYTTDGYGNAVSADGTKTRAYTVNTSMGLPVLTLSWKEADKTMSRLFVDVGENTYFEYKAEYSCYNSNTQLDLVVLEQDNAVVAFYNASSRSLVMFSCGKITWTENANGKFGVYKESQCILSSLDYLADNFDEFKFGLLEITKENGDSVTYFYIYDAGNPAGDTEITGENNEKIIVKLNKTDIIAEYRVPDAEAESGYKTISGPFTVCDGIMSISYTEKNEGGKDVIKSVSFKLIYDGAGAVTSFKKVEAEAGKWWNVDDGKSYIYLTGETNAQGKLVAEYYEYNADYDESTDGPSAEFTKTEGTYQRTDTANMLEYTFSYDTGEVDDDNKPIIGGFTFAIAYSNGLPIMQTKKLEIGLYVFESIGSTQAVGAMIGGGYRGYTLTLGSKQYSGELGYYASMNVFVFTSGSAKLYFQFVVVGENDSKLVLLDGTFAEPNFGLFECAETYTLEIPVKNEDSDDYQNVEYSFNKIRLFGNGVAHLVTNEQENGSYTAITCMYVAYTQTTFVLVAFKGNEIVTLTTFRLYVVGSGDNVTYTAVFVDDTVLGTFGAPEFSTLTLDGYGSGIYVDGMGVAYQGSFAKVEGQTNILSFTYLDGLTTIKIYVELGNENNTKTFTILDADDPRIPPAEETLK